jgi:hypothetical protein
MQGCEHELWDWIGKGFTAACWIAGMYREKLFLLTERLPVPFYFTWNKDTSVVTSFIIKLGGLQSPKNEVFESKQTLNGLCRKKKKIGMIISRCFKQHCILSCWADH